ITCRSGGRPCRVFCASRICSRCCGVKLAMNSMRLSARSRCSGVRLLNLRKRSLNSACCSGGSPLKCGSFSSSFSCCSGVRFWCSRSQSPILRPGCCAPRLGLGALFVAFGCTWAAPALRCAPADRPSTTARHRIPLFGAQFTSLLPRARSLFRYVVRRTAAKLFDQIGIDQNIVVLIQGLHISHRSSNRGGLLVTAIDRLPCTDIHQSPCHQHCSQ